MFAWSVRGLRARLCRRNEIKSLRKRARERERKSARATSTALRKRRFEWKRNWWEVIYFIQLEWKRNAHADDWVNRISHCSKMCGHVSLDGPLLILDRLGQFIIWFWNPVITRRVMTFGHLNGLFESVSVVFRLGVTKRHWIWNFAFFLDIFKNKKKGNDQKQVRVAIWKPGNVHFHLPFKWRAIKSLLRNIFGSTLFRSTQVKCDDYHFEFNEKEKKRKLLKADAFFSSLAHICTDCEISNWIIAAKF